MITVPMFSADLLSVTQPVPHTLHLIWVGSPPPPRVTQAWAHWQTALEGTDDEPGWNIFLHTDHSAPTTWPLTRHLIDHLPTDAPPIHPVVQADIIRIEVLHRHGGVYVDSDTATTEHTRANLTALLSQAFLEGPGHPTPPPKTEVPWLGNGLIGFPPAHPFTAWLWNNLPPRLPHPGNVRPITNPYSLAGPSYYRLAYTHVRPTTARPRVLDISALPDINDPRWRTPGDHPSLDPTQAVALHLQDGAWENWQHQEARA